VYGALAVEVDPDVLPEEDEEEAACTYTRVALDALFPYASVTVTTTENGLPCAVVGVPDMRPLLDMLTPGTVPSMVQVKGPFPVACHW